MTDDLVKRIKERGDWLVDAVATSTQNRAFLRGDPECDDVACDAIRMNSEQVMSQIAKPLTDRIEALEAKLEKTVEALTLYIYETTHLSAEEDDGSHWCKISKDCLARARTTLAELKGATDD